MSDSSLSSPLRSCPHCNRSFFPKRKDQKFCSHSCLTAFHVHRRKNAKLLEIANRTFSCLICGKPFKPATASSKYCSEQCRHIAKNRDDRNCHFRKTGRMSQPLPTHAICPVCGKSFKTSTIHRKFCSKTCALTVSCAFCGKLFIAKNNGGIQYCSKHCKTAARKLLGRKKVKPQVNAKCKFCGKNISKTRSRSNPFCSKTCELAHYKKCGEELTRKSREARELGLSYGQYMAYIQLGLNPADFACEQLTVMLNKDLLPIK